MTAEHLSISPHAACPTGLQPAVDVSSPKTSQTQTTQSFTVNAAPDMSRRGRREKVSLSAVLEFVVWSATAPPSAFLRALDSIQDLHDLLLDDLCGVAGVWYQISEQREDKKTEEEDQYYEQ